MIRQSFNFLKDIYHYARFPHAYVAYRGVFQNFKEAIESKPKFIGAQRTLQYEQAKVPPLESCLETFSKPVKPLDSEYPLLFWLDRIFASNPQAELCDFGGSNGRHYFAYTSTSAHKPKLWQVCELPQNVALGKQICTSLNLQNLQFATTPNPATILLSSSAFQYIENLYELLKEYLTGGGRSKIEYILLARLPVQDKHPTFITLQNALNEFYTPLYIFNRQEFIDFFASLGYELVDEWRGYTDSLFIPFHRDISVPSCSGFYFRLKS